LETQILDAAKNGDVDSVKRILEEHDLKRLPRTLGANGEINI
jgi:hypothetical protein